MTKAFIMKNIKSFLIYTFIICAAAMLSACGSSDDSQEPAKEDDSQFDGKTTEATVTQDNAQAITVAAVNSIDRDKLVDIYDAVVAMLVQAGGSLGTQAVSNGNCGGTVDYPDDLGSANPLIGTLTFTDFCIGENSNQLKLNGSIDFNILLANNVELVSANLTVNLEIDHDGKTKSLDGEINFANNVLAITVSSDYVGADERIYRVENLSITTDMVVQQMAQSIRINSGRFYDPELGHVDLQSGDNAPLLFNCMNGNPSAGKLEVMGSDQSSASIEFLNCDQYQVCMDNVCESYTW